MNDGKLFVLFATLAQYGLAQQAGQGPLGVLIKPPHRLVVPNELRPELPRNAVVRLLQSTTLTSDGERVIVYEVPSGIKPNSHVAIVKNRRMTADLSLAKLFEKDDVGDSYALFSAAQFRPQDNTNAFVGAFRNIGDGAGTLFIIISNTTGRYSVTWQQRVSQGRFKVQGDGKMQLWAAMSDGNCVWCLHRYEVTTFEWKAGQMSKLSHWTTKKALYPSPISNTPIVIEK